MPQRKSPKVDQAVIDEAVDKLMEVLNIDGLSDVDRYFAIDLLHDYGKWCGIASAAWSSINEQGLTVRHSSGGRDNRHYKMVKSESLDIFKSAVSIKTGLAAKISKFVKSGVVDTADEEDEFDAFNA